MSKKCVFEHGDGIGNIKKELEDMATWVTDTDNPIEEDEYIQICKVYNKDGYCVGTTTVHKKLKFKGKVIIKGSFNENDPFFGCGGSRDGKIK